MIKHGLLTLTALAFLVMSSACDRNEPPGPESRTEAMLTGSVAYRERIALSETAVVEITLQDVSRADAAATDIARQRITRPGQVPIPFALPYDPAQIDPRMSYSLRAWITDQGRLMFINDTAYPVLTHGAGDRADMILVRVAGAVDPPGMELEGMFSYLADAARFRDCRDNKSYPVSMEGQYIELERAYLNSGIEPGEEAMVKMRGRLMERPAMEGNHNKVSLIVDNFNSISSEKTCVPETHSELLSTYWRLDKLGDTEVITPEGMREAHMVLQADEPRVRGNAACNNFFGQYALEGEKLSFSALGSTMMACPQGMDTEQGFLAALGNTASYSISGLFLSLYDSAGTLLAVLEAVYL